MENTLAFAFKPLGAFIEESNKSNNCARFEFRLISLRWEKFSHIIIFLKFSSVLLGTQAWLDIWKYNGIKIHSFDNTT